MRPKNILLLYKTSTYQYYQEISSAHRPASDEINRFRKTHEVHYQTLKNVEEVLSGHKLSYQKVMRGKLTDYSAFDFIITVGGDGTFLEGARYINDQAILGVNSDPNWSVGRLCFSDSSNFEEFIDKILSDEVCASSISRLKVSFDDDRDPVYCLNDVLVAHANPASLSRYKISIDHTCEEQRSSGIWISTAAGSTGAIHSAGGKILNFMSDEFQYMPRELYGGWSQGNYLLTGGVLSKDSVIRLTSLMAEGMIFIDGSHQRISFSASECIEISQADRPLSAIQKID